MAHGITYFLTDQRVKSGKVSEFLSKICCQILTALKSTTRTITFSTPTSAFVDFTADGKIKEGSITKRITTEIEKGEKLSLVAKFKQNVPTDYNNNMERLAWFNHDVLFTPWKFCFL